jgi:hypothetical protein
MIQVLGNPMKIWVPVKPTASVYVGSIVCTDLNALDEGVVVMEQADGASNTTNKDVPFGVVVGHNLKTPVFDTTYKADKITAPAAGASHGSTTEYVGHGSSPYGFGDRIPMVEVALITPSTILRAPIFNNAVGTAPSLLTCTTGNTDGLAMTSTATADFTPVANLCSIYCRSGSNAGIYRQTDDTSTTAATWDIAMPNDTVIGDTFVRVPLRPFGLSYVRLGDDTVCSYINCSETPATDYSIIHVTRLDLSQAGKEFAEFYFDGDNFCTVRA